VPPGFVLTTAGVARLDDGSIRSEVLEAYRRLGEGPVAVRSSAVAEDLAEASFAGQQSTFLNVSGAEDLLRAVEACAASISAERAVAYRAALGFGEQA